jgi:hypothetical protein
MGGLSYQVRMVACMQTSWDETGLRLSPLDFDVEKIQSDLPVVKGFIDGHLRFDARQPAVTNVALDFSVTVEVPIPPVLNLLPRGLVQATGDGIMNLQIGMVVTTLFRKVMDDFKLTVNQSRRATRSRAQGARLFFSADLYATMTRRDHAMTHGRARTR